MSDRRLGPAVYVLAAFLFSLAVTSLLVRVVGLLSGAYTSGLIGLGALFAAVVALGVAATLVYVAFARFLRSRMRRESHGAH